MVTEGQDKLAAVRRQLAAMDSATSQIGSYWDPANPVSTHELYQLIGRLREAVALLTDELESQRASQPARE